MLQCTLGFACDLGERAGAWDEVYYMEGATVLEGWEKWLNTAGLLALQRTSLMGRRLQCLSDDCYLYYMRMALVGGAESQVQLARIEGYRGDSNYAGDALNMRAYNAARNVDRQIRLGGLPDNVVSENGVDKGFIKSYVWNGPTDTSTFIGKLIEKVGQIRYRTTFIGGDNSFKILSVSKPTQYGLITVDTNRTIVYDTSIPVVIACKGQPQFRGNWKIASSPTAGVVVLAGSERVSAPSTLQGWVTLDTKAGANIATVNSFFATSHRLGKKKYQRRGRSSPKLLRH